MQLLDCRYSRMIVLVQCFDIGVAVRNGDLPCSWSMLQERDQFISPYRTVLLCPTSAEAFTYASLGSSNSSGITAARKALRVVIAPSEHCEENETIPVQVVYLFDLVSPYNLDGFPLFLSIVFGMISAALLLRYAVIPN